NWCAWPASRRWPSASMTSASSPYRWHDGSRDGNAGGNRIIQRGAPLAARPAVAGPARSVLLRQLWLRQLDGRPSCPAAGDGICLGGADSVRAVDDRAVLVDRPVLCDLVLPVPAPAGVGPARAAPAQRAGDRGGVLPVVAVALQLRT